MQGVFFTPPLATAATRHSADAVLAALARRHPRWRLPASPRAAMAALAVRLGQDRQASAHLRVVDTREAPAGAGGKVVQASAWPLRYARVGQDEMPLLYLVRAQSVAALRALLQASCGRGVVCNDAEAVVQQARWPKGVEPTLPAWLAAQPECLPFDPASGQEARAILDGALRALYLEQQPGFYYLATHDGDVPQEAALTESEAAAACQGMYLLPSQHAGTQAQVRLCGAGSALAPVCEAAQLLWQEWGVAAETWSCPSYTRLARDAGKAEHWNLCHPLEPQRNAHLHRCLDGSDAPVVAASGYGCHIAGQIGAHLRARLIALDADAGAGSIVLAALKALAHENAFPVERLEQALLRYGRC